LTVFDDNIFLKVKWKQNISMLILNVYKNILYIA